MKIVQIKSDGNMIELDEQFTVKNIRKMMREKTKVKKILHLYNWSYDGSMIQCYGCLEGKTGKENKHELPPLGEKLIETIDNSDIQLIFNDIFVVRVENKKYLDFDVSEYGLFYNLCFQGFDDCLSDEETYDEEVDDEGSSNSLNEFIVNDEGSIDSDYELDEDYNEY
uniref:Uncharacterized protein n=1 Tax=viral metagenome TaxID=1070528 RepID=A0A6C0CG99_9ZZZZ